MAQLDAASIPFVIKMADNYGPIWEGNELRKVSNVPHVLVYRLSTIGQNDGFDYDVPRYDYPPEVAAAVHWQATKEKLPPEFDKYVWLEVINEVDKNQSDFLGKFAIEIARLANAEGYKILLFGWSSGEPEPIHWETPSILEFLQYCGENSNKCGIALHEYSYVVNDILNQVPFKMLRFQYLFATCDKHNIPRPTTVMTEWGWTLNDVPEAVAALVDIQTVGQEYAKYDNILGAAIWYLGPDFGGIANKAQRLIKPVTDFTLGNFFEIDDENPQIKELPSIGEWKQYMDTSTIDIEVQIEDRDNYIGGIRGIGGGSVVSFKYRWIYNDGISASNVATNWIDITDPIPDLDLRGIEFNIATKETIVKTVTVECPNPNPPPVEEYPLVVDVSHWQGSINMGIMKDMGVRKLMLKCTEHTTFADGRFKENYNNALAAGYTKKDLAPYHFYRFNKSPVEQANHFLNTAFSVIGEPACAFVVDVEDTENSAVLKSNDLKLFLDIIEYTTGFRPIIYTASWWWTVGRWGDVIPWANDYALVEAEYKYDPIAGFVNFNFAYAQTKITSPTISPDWDKHSFWQFTSKARGSDFGAASEYIDVQSFNGNLTELNALYTKPGTITENPVVGEKIDLLPYLRGANGLQIDTDATTYTQTYNTQWFGDAWRLIKGGNKQYEYLYADDFFIYRREDTSQGNDRFYIHLSNGIQGAPWLLRFMAVGETTISTKQVQHYWNDCTERLPLATVVDSIQLIARYDTYFFDKTNQTVADVIELRWLEGGESYFFARDKGLVGFKDTVTDSQFAGVLEGRTPLEFAIPPCVDDNEKYYV